MSLLRKLTKLALGPAVLTAVLAITTGTALAQCSACVNSVTLPAGNVTFSSVILNRGVNVDLASTGERLLTVTLSNVVPGTTLANDSYAAWCAAWFDSAIQTDGSVGAPVFSSYAPNFPSGARPIVPGNTL